MLLSVIYFSNGRPTEIADRVMVHAIGIDRTDVGYRVTLQIFSPGAGGSETAIDPSQPNVTVVTGDGSSVNSAIRESFGKLGGNVFIGKNQIVMFGKNVDLSKKEDIFSFFLSSSETFLNVDCAVAESTAEEILKIPISGSGITSEKYPMMIEAAAENGRCIKTSFMDLLNGMDSHDMTAVMPVFSAEQSSREDSSESSESAEALPEEKLEITHGALFVGGKYAADITCEQMGYAAMLTGSGKYVRCDITQNGRTMSKTFKVKSTETDARISDGEIIFSVTCSLSPKDSQLFSELSDVDSANGDAVKLIGEKAQSFADGVCENFSPELLNADDYLKRYYPDIYRNYDDDPQPLYEHVKFELNVK
jgi:hypothetical protein